MENRPFITCRIARFRGAKTVQLFDLHMPISRIKQLKIDRDECRNIMSKKEKKVKRGNNEENKIKRKSKVEQAKTQNKEKRQTDENDILQNILNDNVMSVIVNLRMPLEDMKPKIEPLGNDNINADLLIEVSESKVKTEPQNNVINEVVPKTEPYENDNTKLIARQHMRISQRILQRRANEPQSVDAVTPRAVPIINTKISSTSKQSVQNRSPTYVMKQESASKLDRNVRNKGKETQTKEVTEAKTNKHKSCRHKCKERIPEDFTKKILQHIRNGI